MKVIMINGSPRTGGNTEYALHEMEAVFRQNGIDTETVSVGKLDIRGCIACRTCKSTGKCVFDDAVNETAEKIRAAEGLVIATPVYYSGPNGTLVSFLDRLFFSAGSEFKMKVGASVVIARRGGCSSTFDQLNKYFTCSGMPVASSQYWNSVHGWTEGEAARDAEGLQTVRVLANDMTFLMKSIALGKEAYGLPDLGEPYARTNFLG